MAFKIATTKPATKRTSIDKSLLKKEILNNNKTIDTCDATIKKNMIKKKIAMQNREKNVATLLNSIPNYRKR